MTDRIKDIERNALIKLEELSITISNSIVNSEYEKIPFLNEKRLKIIALFKNCNDETIKANFVSLLNNNKNEIDIISNKKKEFSLSHSKFVKRLKAYSK